MRQVSFCSLLALGTVAMAPSAMAELNVVATTGMIADVAENVVGDCGNVTAMMGAGVDPHLYQPSAGDVRLLSQADAILYSGYSLEGQMGEVLDKLGGRIATLAVAPASIAPDQLITTQDIYGIDPHLWMDASLWAHTAEKIAGTLSEIEPECAEDMQTNAEGYQAQLDSLHQWIESSIASIPDQQRVLVTAHDAFAYYGRAYDIDVEGIQGISTEAEAGIGDIRETVDLVVEREVPAIFVETTINPRTIQAVIESARDRGVEVTVGGELFSDAMGEPGTAEGTYIGMLHANTETITEALGGELRPLPEALHDWAQTWNLDRK